MVTIAEPPRGTPPLPGRPLPRVVREFLSTEASGGVVLLLAAVVALVWANSPWRASYSQLWETEVELRFGTLGITDNLRHFVNDALMALFFYVVGLEIKRELVAGELRSWRNAGLPAIAALGGMLVPALLYTALNLEGSGRSGWGVPTATDIAFALGVASLLGRRVPASLKLFLLTLAIVDDIGAIVLIAVFYSGGINWSALAVAAAVLATMGVMRRFQVLWLPVYVALGLGVWLAVYESGVHATIAGVVLGLVTPAHPLAPGQAARDWARALSDDPSPAELRAMTRMANLTVSLGERLIYALHPLTSFVVVPLFALANAGVALDPDALSSPAARSVALGVTVGLVVGKAVGVSGFSWLAVRLGVGSLPEGTRWAQMVGVGALAGIGFTVSLFISGLAFEGARLEAAAKLGILGGSLLASLLASALLVPAGRHSPEKGANRG